MAYGWSDYSSASDGVVPSAGGTCVVPWCVVFADISVPYPTETKVAIRNICSKYFSISQNQWITLFNEVAHGGYDHPEDSFATLNATTVVDSGSQIFAAPPIGSNSEIWGSRKTVPLADFSGLFFSVEHELVMTDGSEIPRSTRIDAQWVVQCGADWWGALTGIAGHSGVGQGRICRARPWWRKSCYYATDGSLDLIAHPPVPIAELI